MKTRLDEVLSERIGVNSEAIGRGVYALLSDDQKVPMAFGMAPAEVMELLEKQIKTKIGEIAAEKYECPELAEAFEGAIDKRAFNKIMHGVYLGMLSAAKEEGKLVV